MRLCQTLTYKRWYVVFAALVAEGFLLVDPRKEKKLSKLVADYLKAQQKAKSSRVGSCAVFTKYCYFFFISFIWEIDIQLWFQANLWRYGDFRADEAKEFGYQR